MAKGMSLAPWRGGRGGSMLRLCVFTLLGASLMSRPVLAAQVGPAPPTKTFEPTATTSPAAKTMPMACDANCVRSNTDPAVLACVPVIEAQAPIDFDWLNRPVPGIFQQAEQPSGRDFVVRYRGDSIRFQTPGRDWARMSYECGYDVETKRVVFLNMHPGRLQMPAPQVTASVILPGPPAAPAQRNAEASMPPAGMQQRATVQQAAQPSRKPPRVGEPSPIEIEQQPPRVRP